MLSLGLQGEGVAPAVEIDKAIGVDGLQFAGGRGVDVYLVVLRNIGPLGLAVKPYDSCRCLGIELTTLYRDGTAGTGILRSTDGKSGCNASFVRQYLGSLVENTL